MSFWDKVGDAAKGAGKYIKEQSDMIQSMKSKSDSELEDITSDSFFNSASSLEKQAARAELKRRGIDV